MPISLSKELQDAVNYAKTVQPSAERAQLALRALDLTSLKGTESKADIEKLVQSALTYNLASVCVMPDKVKLAKTALGANTHIRIATVVNFADGIHSTQSSLMADPVTTAKDVLRHNFLGATQNDIVLDFDGFQSAARTNNAAKLAEIGSKLLACKENIGGSTMKIIIGSAAFNDAALLREACEFSASFAPHCLKSDTGFHPAGGVTLEKAAIMMDVAKRNGLGVKISAGVKDEFHAAQYQALAEAIYGYDIHKKPDLFRIGASSVLPRLVHFAHHGKSLDDTNAHNGPAPHY